MENLDLRTPRGLDRSTMAALAGGLWIRQHRNVLVSGAAGIGKSWIACALGCPRPSALTGMDPLLLMEVEPCSAREFVVRWPDQPVAGLLGGKFSFA
jgi:hypothetical protein